MTNLKAVVFKILTTALYYHSIICIVGWNFASAKANITSIRDDDWPIGMTHGSSSSMYVCVCN
ncbi:hypothetical protein D917_00870 [Trichinella nativa]|uniref:Uncharacterized protein n=1 Tax=Trichinella nativa TaxID=6335 RepID=A0A1Y3E3N4_9BILA|nr:hypothetical protein D917_00870 [Trichinella nativa]